MAMVDIDILFTPQLRPLSYCPPSPPLTPPAGAVPLRRPAAAAGVRAGVRDHCGRRQQRSWGRGGSDSRACDTGGSSRGSRGSGPGRISQGPLARGPGVVWAVGERQRRLANQSRGRPLSWPQRQQPRQRRSGGGSGGWPAARRQRGRGRACGSDYAVPARGGGVSVCCRDPLSRGSGGGRLPARYGRLRCAGACCSDMPPQLQRNTRGPHRRSVQLLSGASAGRGEASPLLSSESPCKHALRCRGAASGAVGRGGTGHAGSQPGTGGCSSSSRILMRSLTHSMQSIARCPLLLRPWRSVCASAAVAAAAAAAVAVLRPTLPPFCCWGARRRRPRAWRRTGQRAGARAQHWWPPCTEALQVWPGWPQPASSFSAFSFALRVSCLQPPRSPQAAPKSTASHAPSVLASSVLASFILSQAVRPVGSAASQGAQERPSCSDLPTALVYPTLVSPPCSNRAVLRRAAPAADMYEAASATLRGIMPPPPSGLTPASAPTLSERLRRFLAISATLHEARALRALGASCREQTELGQACACLRVRWGAGRLGAGRTGRRGWLALLLPLLAYCTQTRAGAGQLRYSWLALLGLGYSGCRCICFLVALCPPIGPLPPGSCQPRPAPPSPAQPGRCSLPAAGCCRQAAAVPGGGGARRGLAGGAGA